MNRQFHVSENILITFLIAVTSRLDAVDAHKNVLQPMGIRRSTVIKRSSRMNYILIPIVRTNFIGY